MRQCSIVYRQVCARPWMLPCMHMHRFIDAQHMHDALAQGRCSGCSRRRRARVQSRCCRWRSTSALATSAPGVGSSPAASALGLDPPLPPLAPGPGSHRYFCFGHMLRATERLLQTLVDAGTVAQRVRCCAVRFAVECCCSQWRGGGYTICHSQRHVTGRIRVSHATYDIVKHLTSFYAYVTHSR